MQSGTEPFRGRSKDRRRGLVAEVQRYLRNQIVCGEFPAGARLQQEQVAERLGMSVTPVREAFVGLASDGWIVLEPNRGAFVRSITHASVQEYAELSQLIMNFIINRAIDRGATAERARLEGIVAELHQVTQPGDVWLTLQDFNRCLCDMGAATRSRSMLRSVGSFIPENLFELVPDSIPTAKELLYPVAQAVLDGDRTAATAAFGHYLDAHVRAVVGLLQDHGVLRNDMEHSNSSELLGR
jgi:DNA-binding GntR family transcriptional regulator